MPDDLIVLRQRARLLLDLTAPRDAMAAYYALHHDPARTRLFVEEAGGQVQGFLAVCQTGRDLFRLWAVLRSRRLDAAAALLQRGLTLGRPYYLTTTPELRPVVEDALEIERAETNRIYRLNLARYTPAINVLVTPLRTADDSLRFVIRSHDQVMAESGINWRSPHFAEVYVWTAPEARGRGWGKAVVDSCVAWVIRSGVQPLYVVAEGNEASLRLAESVGFVDTGAREFTAEGTAI